MIKCGGTTVYSDLEESSRTVKLTWKIKDIFCGCTKDCLLDIQSPEFEFSRSKWCLGLWHFRESGCNNNVCLSLHRKSATNKIIDVFFKISLRDSEGRLQCIFESNKQLKAGEVWFSPKHGKISKEELEAKRKELMPDNNLIVVCELRAGDCPSDKLKKTDCSTLTTRNYTDMLVSDMGLLLHKRKNCDVRIHLGKEEFHAHKIILGARSPVFAAMFENDLLENRTNAVTIQDIRPSDFSVVLDYIYTSQVQELSVEQAIGVYIAADKYDLKGLKYHCRDLLLSRFTTEWFFEIAVLADAHKDGKLMDGAKLFARDNVQPLLSSNKCEEFFKNHPSLALEALRSAFSGFKTKS